MTTTEPAAETLPGKTDHETHEYLRDHGHRIAAAMAYQDTGRRILADDDYPLPEGHEAVIAEATAAMREAHARRNADHEAYAAASLARLHAEVDETITAMTPERAA